MFKLFKSHHQAEELRIFTQVKILNYNFKLKFNT
jgi:hypothetical protein